MADLLGPVLSASDTALEAIAVLGAGPNPPMETQQAADRSAGLDLSGGEVQHRHEVDRREVDPPIQVETAMWSKAGQLD